ncbi:hypothetical protein [Sulfitobacter sp. JB4-11]|uniref:hypothetical protein n=1 Tax=Sulfitobacter rhodophyticola TaxID=3238304 RepID=UPI0035113DEA
MRWLVRWIVRLVVLALLLAVVFIAPVAWVELACRGDAVARPYDPILPPADHRAESRTLLTYPEWHIVHAYDDYAEVIENGDPHEFGYFNAVKTYWTSLCALKKQASAHGGVDRSTKELVYVIGVSFSAEMALKALYEQTFGLVATLVRGDAQSPLDKLSAQQAADYATFLQQVPWYKYDFAADAAALRAAQTDNPRDLERRLALGVEYAAKAAYAGMIAAAVDTVGADELTLRMVVKGPDAAVLEGLDGLSVVEHRGNIIIVEAPRYRALTRLLIQMADRGIDLVEIAGNDDVMFTALSDQAQMADALFSFRRQGYDDYRHLFLVPVSDLMGTLRRFADGPAQVEHVHDY